MTVIFKSRKEITFCEVFALISRSYAGYISGIYSRIDGIRKKEIGLFALATSYLAIFLHNLNFTVRTRQIIRNRAAATLRRPQEKQHIVSNEGCLQNQREHHIILTKDEVAQPTAVSEIIPHQEC